jgi:membrane dipeptidase
VSTTRRKVLKAAASLLACSVRPALAQGLVTIADMHSHVGILSQASLADEMRANGVALVAWALPADMPWIQPVATGIAQKSEPAPGEPAAFFARRIDGENATIARNGLKRVLTRADVDDCVVGGEHGVVLAAEGADFLEGRLDGLAAAVAKGLRHVQLVHYMRSFVGDRQTSEPQWGGGLSDFGQQLVEACNEHGVLIDLAHCAEPAIDQALRISKRPMVWSHSWVGSTGGRWQDSYGFEQRRLSLARARAIADRGGVVGVWSFGLERPNYRSDGWPVGRDDRRAMRRRSRPWSSRSVRPRRLRHRPRRRRQEHVDRRLRRRAPRGRASPGHEAAREHDRARRLRQLRAGAQGRLHSLGPAARRVTARTSGGSGCRTRTPRPTSAG